MIVSCPKCETRFLIEAETLAPDGKRVRCGHCGATWHQAAAEAQSGRAKPGLDPEDRPPIEMLGTPEEFDERSYPEVWQEAQRQGEKLWPRLLVLLGVIASLVALLWFGRDAVVAHYPEAASYYARLGIEVALPDLRVEKVASRREVVGEERRLIIEGSIVNHGARSRNVPELVAELRDDKGQSLASWQFPAEVQRLAPGGRTSFRSSYSNPPDGGTLHIEIPEAE